MLGMVVIFHNKHNTKYADRTLIFGTITLLILNYFSGHHHGLEFLKHQSHSLIHGTEILVVVTAMFILGFAFSLTGLKGFIERKLPDTKWAAFWIIVIVGLMSGAVDNIAMALIGKQIVGIFPTVHPAMYVNLVASSNAGGAPWFTGDTTTFMIANRGHSTFSAIGPSYLTVLLIGLVAMKQQSKYGTKQIKSEIAPLNWKVIFMMLTYISLGISSLLFLNNAVFGFAAGACMFIAAFSSHNHLWEEAKKGSRAGLFLFLLILSVGQLDLSILPDPSDLTAFYAAMVSKVLDNIPVTQAMLDQSIAYPDWGMVAYAVGTFGSANWWASSAGVAMCEEVHALRSITTWLKYSWWLWIAQPLIYWLFVWIYSIM